MNIQQETGGNASNREALELEVGSYEKSKPNRFVVDATVRSACSAGPDDFARSGGTSHRSAGFHTSSPRMNMT